MPAVSGIAYGYRAGSRWDLLYKTLHVSSVKLDCVTDNATNAVCLATRPCFPSKVHPAVTFGWQNIARTGWIARFALPRPSEGTPSTPAQTWPWAGKKDF